MKLWGFKCKNKTENVLGGRNVNKHIILSEEKFFLDMDTKGNIKYNFDRLNVR